MFPIPWNFPFRKKNGDMSTIGDVIGGEGSELPPHSASDAGKLLGVKLDGSLEWSDEVNSEIQTLTQKTTITSDTSTLFKYHKVNSIVTMQLVGQQTYADIKNLTIPVGFRPNSIVTVLGYCVSGNSRYLGVVNFNPNGAISIGKIVNDAFTTPSDSDSFEFSTCYYAGN